MNQYESHDAGRGSTLPKQLLLSHLRVAGLAAIVLFFGALALQRITTPIEEIRLVNVPSANAASQVQLGLQRSEANLRGWVAMNDVAFKEQVELAWDEEISPAFESLRTLSDVGEKERQELLSMLASKLTRLRKLQEWTIYISEKPGNEPAKLVFTSKFGPAREALVQLIKSSFDLRKVLDVGLSEMIFELRLAIAQADAALGRFVVEGEKADAESYQNYIDEARAILHSPYATLLEQKTLISQLEAMHKLSESIVRSKNSSRSNIAWHTIRMRVVPLSDSISELFSSIAEQETSTMREKVDDISQSASTLSLWSVFSLIFLVVTATLLARKEAARISAPVTKLFHATQAMQKGDYEKKLNPEGVREVYGLIEGFNEMRTAIWRSHQYLEKMAFTDELTGLGNRKAFNRMLSGIQPSSTDAQQGFGLIMIDLNRFKQVNEMLGHDAGDKLLVELGHRLKQSLRSSDVAARLGGDEFTVLLGEVPNESFAEGLVKSIHKNLCKPVYCADKKIIPHVSIGVTLNLLGLYSGREMLKQASYAVNDAKACAEDKYCLYSQKLHEKAARSQRLAEIVEQTSHDDIFHLVYQPYVELSSGRTIGTEALLRCTHAEATNIPIFEIITMLERNGHITTISKWVMQKALHQLVQWQSNGDVPEDFTMSVNVSAELLRDDQFMQDIIDLIHQAGIQGHSLTIELTETTVMEDYHDSREAMQQLSDLGIKFAMDDFGTGYSSMERLKEMPLSLLKIDKTFVDGMLENANDGAIVDASLLIGQAIGMLVTAEGIETAEQAEALRKLGCDRGQGYYFSRPQKPSDLIFHDVPKQRAA